MVDQPAFERQYDLEDSEEKIILRIFDPRPQDDGGWECPYWLAAPHLGWKSKLRAGAGDDNMDAFISALTLITIELRYLASLADAPVTFMGDPDLDLIDRDYIKDGWS